MSARIQRSLKLGLVPFLFGAARSDELSGVALTRLLVDLGMTRSAARGQLARMRREGQLSAGRQQGRSYYRLAGPFADSFHRVRVEEPAPPPPWLGHFHGLLYQVPESKRPFRDRLRRSAMLLGYGLLQHGVLIAVEDHAANLKPVLDERPPGSEVRTVTIGMDTGQAAKAALEAWDLTVVGRSLGRHVTVLRAGLRHQSPPPPTAETLRRFAELFNAPSVDLLDDPGLPPQLLPADWPRPGLEALMRDVAERYGPPSAAYARSVISATERS